MIDIKTDIFKPELREEHDGIILLYVGRIIVDSTLKDFLTLPEDLGHKIVAGYGKDANTKSLNRMFPKVEFVTFNSSEEVAPYMANADVVVSPLSLQTVTEANACGTPIALKPTSKANKYITDFENGVINKNLEMAVIDAATLDRKRVEQYAREYLILE